MSSFRSVSRPRLRVLHIVTVPDTLVFFTGQAAYMRDRGVVLEVCASPGDALFEFGASQEVAAHAVPMARRIAPVRDAASLTRLIHLVSAVRPHIVHCHTPKAGLLGVMAARLLQVPSIVYQLHGLPLETATGSLRRVLRATEKLACSLSSRVLAVSDSLKEVALELDLTSPDKIGVLGRGSFNGVDSDRTFRPGSVSRDRAASLRATLGIPPQAPVIGFVGRIVRDKGVQDLIDAWGALRVQHPDAHLVLVGPAEKDDAILPNYMELVRGDSRIHTIGAVPQEALPTFYAAFDVLALPTHREGFGVVAIEAGAMELPVVACRVTGCVDAICDGVTGTLVPAREPGQLSAALSRYLCDPELAHTHGSAARRWVVKHFRREVLWDALYCEYRRLHERRNRS